MGQTEISQLISNYFVIQIIVCIMFYVVSFVWKFSKMSDKIIENHKIITKE